MQLHHTSGKPDWFTVKKSDYNVWQKLARSTNGIVTPGNITTVLGFGLVIVGLLQISFHHYWLGIVTVSIGRMFDLLDGWLAEKTQTKSPLGESFDAIADKLGTLFTLVVLVFTHIVPIGTVVLVAAPQLILPFFTLIAHSRHKSIHPSRAGKLSMAFAWVSLAGFVILKAADLHAAVPLILATAFAITSSAFGLYAAIDYAKVIR